MADHKGWRVKEAAARGGWLGMVSLGGEKYRTKLFRGRTAEKQAREWGRTQAAARAVRGTTTLEGRTLTVCLAADYLDELVAAGRSPSHLDNVSRTLGVAVRPDDRRDTAPLAGSVAREVPDLAAPDARERVRRWLAGLVIDGQARATRSRRGEAVSPATRNRKLTELRGLVRWAMDHDRLERDPTRGIKRSTEDSRVAKQFTVAEIREILCADHPYALRFALMTLAGLRVGEATGIRWEDVNWGGACLTVRLRAGTRIKRRKERVVPLVPDLALLLRLYGKHQDDPQACIAAEGGRNDRISLARLLTAARVPLNGRHPHSCRHSYGGIMSATGINPSVLQTWMGHAAAATSMGYAKKAAQFFGEVQGWKPGEFNVLQGAACPIKQGR